MFSLSGGEELDAFRNVVREKLSSIDVPEVARDSSLENFIEIGRSWQESLASVGLVGVHWPVAYGGQGLRLVEEAVVQEELAKIGAPQLLGLFGLTMVGPILIEHGTDEQRERFLAPILNAQDVWCQGFSEPGAGSDLAAISTVAKKVAGGYELSGQKVWTSFAQVANWCFVLARTGEESERYKNLTYLLVDMNTAGIEVRPLKQITGDEEFNEVFFDGVFIPDEQRVGEEGQGWKIAIGTLMHERVILTFARQIQSERVLRDLLAQYMGASSESTKAEISGHELSKLIIQGFSTRALAYQHLASYSDGTPPGPEGSLDKLGWSEFFQKLSSYTAKIDGAMGIFETPAVERYLYSRGRTIAAGTSEIQRSIVADRILGLPRGR